MCFLNGIIFTLQGIPLIANAQRCDPPIPAERDEQNSFGMTERVTNLRTVDASPLPEITINEIR